MLRERVHGAHEGHHGGAWKVAYADFVTAMMAFFLLMWLLGATTEDQRKGIADYFAARIPISPESAGGDGVLEGGFVPRNAEAQFRLHKLFLPACDGGGVQRIAKKDATGREAAAA